MAPKISIFRGFVFTTIRGVLKSPSILCHCSTIRLLNLHDKASLTQVMKDQNVFFRSLLFGPGLVTVRSHIEEYANDQKL